MINETRFTEKKWKQILQRVRNDWTVAPEVSRVPLAHVSDSVVETAAEMGAEDSVKPHEKDTYGSFVLLRMPVLHLRLDVWCVGESAWNVR